MSIGMTYNELLHFFTSKGRNGTVSTNCCYVHGLTFLFTDSPSKLLNPHKDERVALNKNRLLARKFNAETKAKI